MRFGFAIIGISMLSASAFGQSPNEAEIIATYETQWQAYSDYVSANDYESAVSPAREVLRIARQYEPENASLHILLGYNLGVAYFMSGAPEEAKATFMEVVGADAGSAVPNTFEVASAHLLLGELTLPDDRGGALRHWKTGLEGFQSIYGEDDPRVAAAHRRYGIGLMRSGKPAAARKQLDKAVALAEVAGPEFAFEHAYALLELAVNDLGHSTRRAEERLRTALEVLGDTAPNPTLVMRIHAGLVAAFVIRGDEAAATRHLKMLAEIFPQSDSGEPTPVYRVAPGWPREAQVRGIDGYADYSFTVDADGRVRDVEVVKSRPKMFAKYGADAIRKYRFVPRIVNGDFVETRNREIRLVWQLEGRGNPVPEEDRKPVAGAWSD